MDGSGAPPFVGDILVENSRIVMVGGAFAAENAQTLDAQGLIAAPGLIDAHSHNELEILRNPQHESAITQGITTEVVGQCGLGVAPMSHEQIASTIRLYAGILGPFDSQRHRWASFGEFHSRLNGAALNVACPVSHSALRTNALGFGNRKADQDAIKRMQADAAQAMEQGAVGFSTGLTYYPAGYSDTNELVAICEVIKRYDGVFLPHKRDNFDEPRDVGDAECVRIIRETGVRTHVLHYKTGPGNAGDIQSLLAPYAPVLNGNYDVSFELYPYTVGAGYAVVFLPPWAMEDGFDAVMERLGDHSLRKRIEADARRRYNYIMTAEGITFSSMKTTREWEGKTLADVCAARGLQPIPALLDLLLENELEIGYHANPPAPSPVQAALEEDFLRLLDLPNYTVGSDSIVHGSHPHPRAFGSFPKLLRLARERSYPLERLIHKMTAYTAGRYRLPGKGRIAPGMDADICVFDFATVSDRATFSAPRAKSVGMRHVLVNGELALRDGLLTGAMAGRALRPGIR